MYLGFTSILGSLGGKYTLDLFTVVDDFWTGFDPMG